MSIIRNIAVSGAEPYGYGLQAIETKSMSWTTEE